MTNLFARLAMATSAAALTLSPVVAQANTRAGDYSTSYSNDLGNFGATWSAEEFWFGEERELGSWVYAMLGGAAVIVGIIILSSDDSGTPPLNQSPGAS